MDVEKDKTETQPEPEPAAKADPEPATLRSRLAGLPLPHTRKGRLLAAAALVVVIALAVGGFRWYQSTRLPDDVAFRVYGQDETVQQLDQQMLVSRALYGVQRPADGPRLDAFRRDFAKETAVSVIIDKVAADRNITATDEQVAELLARYIIQFYGEGRAGRDRYVQALAKDGTSETKVIAELARQVVLRQLLRQVTGDITVSDQDVRQAFDQRRDELATPERREIHNIVLRTKVEADQLVAEANGGANFEALAQQRSLDSNSKNQGGNLGLIAARQLEPPYAAAAFAAPVGSVFGPVQTQYGFNVGKIVQSQPPGPAVFDQIKDQLRQLLLSERTSDRWRAFLVEALERADVRYADEYRPADPDAPPSATPAPPR